ncbi:internalin [Aquipluma nitroreducens]|uniref:Internalin n=1 Tax=Aquipluma nitroreducens TaxID=2010828 RepID=A0A5K7SAT9_9BACT|nr:internalin [Aquipluma nitroreducens]
MGIFVVFSFSNLDAATIISTGTGGAWSNPATWVGRTVPVAGDDVTIVSGAMVIIDSDITVGTLTVSGTLQFNELTPQVLTANNIITVNAKGIFRSAPSGTVKTHQLIAQSSIINNGTIDFSSNLNETGVEIIFTGSGNAIFSCSDAVLTNLRKTNGLMLNKGTSAASVLSFMPGNTFQVLSNGDSGASGFLSIVNGTFNIIGSRNFSNPVFNTDGNYTIPATGGFWLGNQNATVIAMNGTVTVLGELKIANGTYSVGISGSNSLEILNDGQFKMSGGILNISGKLKIDGGAGSVSGGKINLAPRRNLANVEPTIHISADARFEMYGVPLITLAFPNSNPIPSNDIQILDGSGFKSIKGGTIQLGTEATPVGSTFLINANTILSQLTAFSACTIHAVNTSDADVTNTPIGSLPVIPFDLIAPELTAPAKITIQCGETIPAAYATFQEFTNAGGSATDNCTLKPASFKLISQVQSKTNCPYTISRTYEISDVSGNVGKAEQQIVVEGESITSQPEVIAESPVKEELKLKSAMAVYTATQNGNWNDPATWGNSGPPTSADDVNTASYTVTVNADSSCKNITIGAGGTLNHSGTNTLTVTGDWTNNGTYNAGTGIVSFSNTGSTINGATTFGILVINSGSNVNSNIIVNSDLTINDLQLINGLLKINGGTTTITALNEPTVNPIHNTIPKSAGLEVNSGGKLVTQDFTINNKGLIRINSGTANFGNSTGNSVETNTDGAFIVEGGGTVNIAGRLHNSASGTVFGTSYTSGITISSGTVTLSTKGNALSNVGSLNVTSAGTFNFNGGTIIFQNASTATTELDLGLLNGTGTKNISGGTFQFGNGSPSGETYNIISEIPLYNLKTNGNANIALGSTLILGNPLTLNGASKLFLNGNSIQIPVSATGTYTFPITDASGTAIPVTVNLTGGSGAIAAGAYIEIKTFDTKYPDNDNVANYLNRYWTLTTSGITSPIYTVNATYLSSDLHNTPAHLTAASYLSPTWTKIPGATIAGNVISFSSNVTSLEFTALDAPTITITNADPEVICNNSAVTLSTTTTADPPALASYSWSSNPAGFTGSTQDLTITPTIAGTYTFTITVTDGNGFTATDATTVTVNPLPVINNITLAAICSGGAFTVTPANGADGIVPVGTTYTWIAPTVTGITGAVAGTNAASISGTLTNTTNAPINVVYTVTPTSGSCAGSTFTVTVPVNPKPAINNITLAAICSGGAFTVTPANGTDGIVPAGTTYSWAAPAVAGITGTVAGTNAASISGTLTNTTNALINVVYTVTPISGSCAGSTFTVTVPVNPKPAINNITLATICSGGTFTTTPVNGTDGIVPTGTTYSWAAPTVAGITGAVAGIDAASISGTLTNTTNSNINVVYSVIPTSGGCFGASFSVTVTVYPLPTVTAPPDKTYCMGETTLAIPLVGVPSGVVFDISGGATIGLTNKTGVTQIPSYAATTGSATITITPRANGCTGTPVTFNVAVNPRPNIHLSASARTICSGESTNISISSTTPGATFSWDVYSMTGTISGAGSGTGNLLNQTLLNNAPTSGTVVYQVTASTGTCEGATINLTVNVHPAVSAIIAGTTTVCQDDSPAPSITFTASGGTAPYTFTYTINGGANQQVVANSGSTATVTAPTNVAGTFVYQLVSVAGSTGCAYPQTGTATVTVNPKPVLTSTLTPPGICSNTSFNYTHISSLLNTDFHWVREVVLGISNPREEGDNIYPDETLVNTTTSPIEVVYTYTLTANECTNVQYVKVMVTQSPVLMSTLTPATICSGTTFSYTPTSNINPGTSFSWTRAADGYGNSAKSGTGNPNEILYNNSTSAISVIYHYSLSSNGCTNPLDYQVIVSVIPAPIVTASASEYNICPGTKVDLFSGSNISSGLPTTILTENFNGTPSGWIITPTTGEAAWTSQIDGYDYILYIDHKKPKWTETIHNVFHSNDNSTFYLSNNHADGGGTDSRLVTPKFSTNGYTSVTLTFWHHYSDGNKSKAFVDWSTNGATWTNLQTFDNSDYGTTDGFVQAVVPIPVGHPSVYIRFRHQADDDYWWAIDNVSITGVLQVTPAILWTSSTSSWTSTLKDPTGVSPAETTTYTVTYTDTNTGCSGSASTTVNVYPTPDATIHADYCVASPKIRLTTGAFSTYSWSPLPLGETNGKQYIDIDIAGIYTVNVTDAHGCSGTASINVSNEYVVNGSFNSGTAGFITDYLPRANLSSGTRVVNGITYTGGEGFFAVGSDAHDYHTNFWGWDHTVHDGNAPNNFLIVNGVGNTLRVWEETVTVAPNTNYYFSAWAINLNDVGPNSTYWPRLQFFINDDNSTSTIAQLGKGITGSSQNNPWLDKDRFYGVWNSGSNTTAKITIKQLNAEAAGNDFGIDDISFGILDPSPAAISPSKGGDVCAGESINLHANVTGGKEPILFSWSGPNGYTSHDSIPVIPNATIAYSGTYTLTVSDWYGCAIAPKTVDVVVYPAPTVNAGPDQLYGCSATSVFTLNGSVGGSATSGTWTTSGDGTFDDIHSMTAVYTIGTNDITAGSVTLTLTTDDPTGPCVPVSDDMVITIHRSPELTVVVANPLCAGYSDGSATASVTNGTAPYTYLWSDGQTTAKATDLADGTYTVTVTDANNCTDTKSIVVVEPTPLVVSPASFTPPTCYGGNDGTATVNAEGGTEPYVYQWDAATGNQTTKTAVGLKVGIYLFTVTDANGCNITSDFVLVTQPEPPDLFCPMDPEAVQAAAGETTADVILDDPIYDPDCQILSWTMSGATVSATANLGVVPSPYTFNVGTTTVEYKAVDVANNVLTCTFDVVVTGGGADLAITKTVNPSPVNTGDQLVYTITVTNAGPSEATAVKIADVVAVLPSPEFTTDLVNEPWKPWVTPYDAGNIASGGSATIYIRGAVPITQCAAIGNTATVTSDTNDDDLTNNSATITTTVTDNQPPTFTLPVTPLPYCVSTIQSAVYNPTPTAVPPGYPEYNDLTTPRPEYYQFTKGSTIFDLDPAIGANNFEDNCCPVGSLILHWRIDIADTPDPLNPAPAKISYAPITGTDQPSKHDDFRLPGDGVTFTDVIHQISYWLEDCTGPPGNMSPEQSRSIIISPRPNIIKMP